MLLLPYFVPQGELASRFDFSGIRNKNFANKTQDISTKHTYISCLPVDEVAASLNFEHLGLEN